MSVEDVRLIELPKFLDARGNLSFAEEGSQIPFPIRRTYWIYDVPGGEERGAHAFRKNQEVVIALSGAFDVVVDDGTAQKTFSLKRSYYALYIPSGLWRSLDNFSTNSVALIVASTLYVVPPGTAGNSPASPYVSWATAANDLAAAIEAAQARANWSQLS